MMDSFLYLTNCLKTEIFVSPINGVGTKALVDMNVGDSVFDFWRGETNNYQISIDEFNTLPAHAKMMILKSYENKEQSSVIAFKLTKDCYWNLANPWAYVNTSDSNNISNIDNYKRVVTKPIKAGEELIGNYDLTKTILK